MKIPEPTFDDNRPHQDDGGNNFAAPSLLQDFKEVSCINNPEGTAGHVLRHLGVAGPVRADGDQSSAGDKRFAFAVQELIGSDSDKRAAHEGAPLARADELFARNRVQKFKQVPIEIGIALLVCWR